MNKFNKLLSYMFGMSILLSNNSISAMDDYNADTEYFQCFFNGELEYGPLQANNFNSEETKRYIYEANELYSRMIENLINFYPTCRRSKGLIDILSNIKQALLLVYVAINVLTNGDNGKLDFICDKKKGQLFDHDSRQDSQDKYRFTIEYDRSDDVRKYRIYGDDYIVELKASKIDLSTETLIKFFLENRSHFYGCVDNMDNMDNVSNEKVKKFKELYKSDKDSLFSEFKKNPYKYMIEKDEFEFIIKTSKNEEILGPISFYC